MNLPLSDPLIIFNNNIKLLNRFRGYIPAISPGVQIQGLGNPTTGNQKPQTSQSTLLKNTRAMVKKAPCTLACTATLAESKPEAFWLKNENLNFQI